MAQHVDPLIEKLMLRLHDQDPCTRRNAAGALRLHGARATAAVEELAKLLADGDLRVRLEARRAIDRLRTAAA